MAKDRMAEYLEKLASRVETEGIAENKQLKLEKIAQASGAIRALGAYDIPKLIVGAAAIAAGAKIVGKGAELIEDKIKDKKFETKKKEVIIPFAKKKYPALKKVPNEELSSWLNSARAMAPEVASDPELASTYLNNVHALGGQVDLNTANTLSSIGKNNSYLSSSLHQLIAGQIGNASNLLS